MEKKRDLIFPRNMNEIYNSGGCVNYLELYKISGISIKKIKIAVMTARLIYKIV